jgi:hypothetical protein
MHSGDLQRRHTLVPKQRHLLAGLHELPERDVPRFDFVG